MRRIIVLTLAALVGCSAAGVAGVTLAGCSIGGGTGGGANSLSTAAREALNKFDAALNRLKGLDIAKATKVELTRARSDVAKAWAQVKARSSEFGQQRWNDLQAAYGKVDKALSDAINGGSLSRAAESVKRAVADVGARLKQYWGDLLNLL